MPTLVLVVSHIANRPPEIIDNRQNRHDQYARKKCFHLIVPSFAVQELFDRESAVKHGAIFPVEK